VLAFNAGRLRYLQPIDDPIYSSHLNHDGHGYWPDYEYTAMACVEQHRLCHSVPSGTCTEFTSSQEAQWQFANQEGSRMDEATAQELEAFQEIGSLDVSNFLGSRGISALLPSQPNIRNWINIQIDPIQQWTWDVQAWFESSFLLFRVHLFAVITGDRVGLGPITMPEQVRDKICGHALFMDGDYTNINFLGLAITLFLVAIISGFSHLQQMSKSIHYARRFVCRGCRQLEVRTRRFWLGVTTFSLSKQMAPKTSSSRRSSESCQTSNQGADMELNLSASIGPEALGERT